MLALGQRLRRRNEFVTAVRSGRRVGRGAVVVHILTPAVAALTGADQANAGAADRSVAGARAGFVVSRSVGPAVVRNKVRRRLRHLVRERLGDLPAGTDVVIRALPGAVDRSYEQLGFDLNGALDVALAPRGVRRTGRSQDRRR